MDKHFDNWKNEEKEFCSKAGSVEIQILYIMQDVGSNIDTFIEMLKSHDKDYREVDMNKMINKLSSIRTYIRHLKGERNRF